MINKIFNTFCALLIIAVPLAAVKAKSQASHISYEDTVVVYFSAGKHTKIIADYISKKLGCNSIEIEPLVPYTNDDLNYRVEDSRVSLENFDPHARPLIKNINELKQLDKYKRVIIGSPVWFRKSPKIIKSLLDDYDLQGKEIFTFVTSGGFPVYTFIEDLKEKYPNLNFKKAIRFKTNESDAAIDDWLKHLDK